MAICPNCGEGPCGQHHRCQTKTADLPKCECCGLRTTVTTTFRGDGNEITVCSDCIDYAMESVGLPVPQPTYTGRVKP